MPLLWRYVCGRYDVDVWIDQEKREDFAVAGFSRVSKAEGGNAVLEDVGPGDQTAFFADHVSHILDACALVGAAEDIAQPFEVVLFVRHFHGCLHFAVLPEGQTAFGDVVAAVVVQRCGAYVFVLPNVN